MPTAAPVILLEFNELTLSLVEQFMAEGRLPNFQRFYRESQAYITDAGEEQRYLDPWIQWVTVHTGLSPEQHGILRLGEGHKLAYQSIWDFVSAAGRSVWVCGSMNVKHDMPLRGYVLPDPWTTETTPYPTDLWPYFRFVQKNVQEHTRDRVPLGPAECAEFLTFMARHGLSLATIRAIVQQLVSERGGRYKWKRAVLLDKLQWDVFRYYFRKLQPALSTFFLNSTAHLQHKYWRNMEPDGFKIKPTAPEDAQFGTAVLFGYQEMDKLLARFMALAGDGVTLVLCTAFGQQPCLLYEEDGGKTFYRPRDFESLLAFAGITASHTVSPVMSEQFHVLFGSERDAQEAERLLASLHVAQAPAMRVTRNGAGVFAGCGIFGQLGPDAALCAPQSGATRPFFELLYQAEGIESGMHHPDGFLWIRTPQRAHRVYRDRVPLASVAPTVLELLGLPRPNHMRAEPLAA